MDRTKEIEEYYFKNFCECSIQGYKLDPNLAVYADKPDVIYDDRIGIEITNLFIEDGNNSTSPQRQAQIRENFLHECQTKFQSEYNLSIEINVGFSSIHPLSERQKTRKAVVSKFTERVHTLYTTNHRESVDLNKFSDIPEIRFLYIHDKVYDKNEWKVTQVYSTQEINPDRLKSIIQKKENRSAKYINFSENWLLIVIDNIDPAQDQYIPNQFNFTYQSTFFNRILIFQNMYRDIHEIKAF